MKVTCVKRRDRKWKAFMPLECEHAGCISAAVARRIQGPVTLTMMAMAGALKQVYDDYLNDTHTKVNYGYWQTMQGVLSETQEEVPDETSGKDDSKTDRA